MGFPRQEYWSRLPFPSLGDLPDPGIKPVSPASQADSSTTEPPREAWTVSGHTQTMPTRFLSLEILNFMFQTAVSLALMVLR